MTTQAESKIVEAISGNLYQSYLSIGQTTGGEIGREADLTWIYTGQPFLNRVFDAHIAGDAAARIRSVQQRYAKWQVPVSWVCDPATEPADLAVQLQAQGFQHAFHSFGMALEMPSWQPRDLPPISYERVADDQLMQVWANIVSAAFHGFSSQTLLTIFSGISDPRWSYYLGFVQGKPVTTVSLLTTGETVGVYWVGTLPAVRGQGLAASLLNAVLSQEIDKERQKLIILHALEPAHNLYLRLGFEDYCSYNMYGWSAEQPK
ncbi:MAG: GNAT family N-acetyltransferase [Anaerolineae bacterium]